jgi:hypothetical protein
MSTNFLQMALLAGVLATTACGNGTETPPETHAPVSAALEVNGVLSSDNFVFLVGAAVPVEVKFYDDEGAEITGIDDDHFATITFAPSTLATVADVAGEHFHKTVTGGGETGSGTLTIGYGHDEAADELSFGPFAVSVVAAAQ